MPHPYSRARLDELVARIEAALREGDRAAQSALVRQSADLLTKRWSRLTQAEKPGFDALLVGLCGQIDSEARAAFAERLADLRLGPPRASRRLAGDPALAVAGPLLGRCASLDPDFLAGAAATLGDPHRLAIAGRPELPPAVTDPLLRHGDGRVAARLLDNPGARFSEAGFASLIAHSAQTEAVTLRLALRPDLPRGERPALLALTRARALSELRFDLGGDRALEERLLAETAASLARPVPEPRIARFASSAEFVRRSFAAAPPDPARLLRWSALRRTEDVLAGLARGAGLPLPMAVAAFDAEAPATLAVLLRGLDHPWPVLKGLLALRQTAETPFAAIDEAFRIHRTLGGLAARRLVRLAALGQGSMAFPDEPSV